MLARAESSPVIAEVGCWSAESRPVKLPCEEAVTVDAEVANLLSTLRTAAISTLGVLLVNAELVCRTIWYMNTCSANDNPYSWNSSA